MCGMLSTLGIASAHATSYQVWSTQIQVYVQSETGNSTAHMLQSKNGIFNNGPHPWCINRAYIDFKDKALLAIALTASMSKQEVNFLYEDASTDKIIDGHAVNRCKVISIFTPQV